MKGNLCYRCKKNKAGKCRDVSFAHLGLKVKIFKSGMICAGCAKEEWIKDFEENAKEFISATDGREIFFHRSSLIDGKFDALSEEQAVEFEVEKSPKGPRAINVRVVQ